MNNSLSRAKRRNNKEDLITKPKIEMFYKDNGNSSKEKQTHDSWVKVLKKKMNNFIKHNKMILNITMLPMNSETWLWHPKNSSYQQTSLGNKIHFDIDLKIHFLQVKHKNQILISKKSNNGLIWWLNHLLNEVMKLQEIKKLFSKKN